MLSHGEYKAKFSFSMINKSDYKNGILTLRATLEHSSIHLAERKIYVDNNITNADFYLEFKNIFLNSKNFELIVEIEDIDDISFDHVVIEKISNSKEIIDLYNRTNARKNIEIHQLSPFLKNTIMAASKFMNTRKRNKLFRSPALFFKDSKNPITKIIGKFYEAENNINQ